MQLALPLPSKKTPFWQCKSIQLGEFLLLHHSAIISLTTKHSQIHEDGKTEAMHVLEKHLH